VIKNSTPSSLVTALAAQLNLQNNNFVPTTWVDYLLQTVRIAMAIGNRPGCNWHAVTGKKISAAGRVIEDSKHFANAVVRKYWGVCQYMLTSQDAKLLGTNALPFLSPDSPMSGFFEMVCYDSMSETALAAVKSAYDCVEANLTAQQRVKTSYSKPVPKIAELKRNAVIFKCGTLYEMKMLNLTGPQMQEQYRQEGGKGPQRNVPE